MLWSIDRNFYNLRVLEERNACYSIKVFRQSGSLITSMDSYHTSAYDVCGYSGDELNRILKVLLESEEVWIDRREVEL